MAHVQECGGGSCGDCCDARATPGCAANPTLANCVCEFDATCCTQQWAEQCVDIAANECDLVCSGGTGNCDDEDDCTDDTCNTETGLCETSQAQNGTECDDDDACTTGDTCQGGVCTAGDPVTCGDDGNDCTQDVCNPSTGSCGVKVIDGTACQGETSAGLCLDGYCYAEHSGCQVDCDTAGGESSMVYVTAGTFWRGCNSTLDSECQTTEEPYREITMRKFAIDREEATVADYILCEEAMACPDGTTNPFCNYQLGDNSLPMDCVRWPHGFTGWLEARRRQPLRPARYEWKCEGVVLRLVRRGLLHDLTGKRSNRFCPGTLKVTRGGEYRSTLDFGINELRNSDRSFFFPTDADYPIGIRCCTIVSE